MIDNTPSVYSHSGKLGAGPFVVPLGGLLASVVLASVYAYVDVYSPIGGYISLIFVGGLAFGLGWSISKLGYLANCRNPKFLRLAGLACGIVALYISWAVFVYALMGRSAEEITINPLAIVLSPLGVWEIAKELNTTGWFSMFGGTPSGNGLWFIWGTEALIIVAGTALFSAEGIDGHVFCDDCNTWCKRSPDTARFGLPEDPTGLQELQPDNLNPILALQSADSSATSYLRVDTWKCRSCSDTSALQLKLCATVPDKDGKSEEKSEDLTPLWSVASATLEEVKNAGNAANVTAQESPESD